MTNNIRSWVITATPYLIKDDIFQILPINCLCQHGQHNIVFYVYAQTYSLHKIILTLTASILALPNVYKLITLYCTLQCNSGFEVYCTASFIELPTNWYCTISILIKPVVTMYLCSLYWYYYEVYVSYRKINQWKV